MVALNRKFDHPLPERTTTKKKIYEKKKWLKIILERRFSDIGFKNGDSTNLLYMSCKKKTRNSNASVRYFEDHYKRISGTLCKRKVKKTGMLDLVTECESTKTVILNGTIIYYFTDCYKILFSLMHIKKKTKK